MEEYGRGMNGKKYLDLNGLNFVFTFSDEGLSNFGSLLSLEIQLTVAEGRTGREGGRRSKKKRT